VLKVQLAAPQVLQLLGLGGAGIHGADDEGRGSSPAFVF